MKYLVIGALLALVFVVIYSRLRPYLELLRKISTILKGTLDAASGEAPERKVTGNGDKLIRCVACGTWVPARRVIGLTSGLSSYCSRECLEKASTEQKRKLAG